MSAERDALAEIQALAAEGIEKHYIGKMAKIEVICRRALEVSAEGAQARPEPIDTSGTFWLKHDEDLRYVRRVLESEATPEDRRAAIDIIHKLRTMVRAEYAQAKGAPHASSETVRPESHDSLGHETESQSQAVQRPVDGDGA